MVQRYTTNPSYTNLKMIMQSYPVTRHFTDENGNSVTITSTQTSARIDSVAANMDKELVKLMAKAKPSTKNVYFYILHKLGWEKDVIELKVKDIMELMDMSESTVILGIKELVDFGIIFKKTRSRYWINMKYIFNGNRAKFLKKQGLFEQVIENSAPSSQSEG